MPVRQGQPFRAPPQTGRELPILQMLGKPSRDGIRPWLLIGSLGIEGERRTAATPAHIFDSERIAAAAWANAGASATSGSTVTSTRRTQRGEPSSGSAEVRDGT